MSLTPPPPPPLPPIGQPSFDSQATFGGQSGFPPSFGQPVAPAPVPFASWGTRVLAYLIDALILLAMYIPLVIIVLILSQVSSTISGLVGFVGYLVLAVLPIYWSFQSGKSGQTPGKKVMGIQVVNVATGQFIGGGMGIVRQFAHFVDAIICYIGFLFPLWDAKKQTLADKMMSSVVIAGPKSDFVSAVKSGIPGLK